MLRRNFMLGACAALCLAGTSMASAQTERLLRVGTEPTFAPFEFRDTETGEYSGFDMDLIRAVGKKAGYRVEILINNAII